MIATILRENAQAENVTVNLAGNYKTALVNFCVASMYIVLCDFHSFGAKYSNIFKT